MAYTQTKANLKQTGWNNAGAIVSQLVAAGLVDKDEVLEEMEKIANHVFEDLAALHDADPPPAARGRSSSAPRTPKVADDPGSIDLKFGKHKGKTIAEVAEEEASYLDWIAKGTDPKGAYLRAQVEAFLDSRRAGE